MTEWSKWGFNEVIILCSLLVVMTLFLIDHSWLSFLNSEVLEVQTQIHPQREARELAEGGCYGGGALRRSSAGHQEMGVFTLGALNVM